MSQSMHTSRVVWRWEEKDFGFRFRAGKGKRLDEYYQAVRAGEFYIVPKSKRKLSKARADELANAMESLTSPRVVQTPWQDYGPLQALIAEWADRAHEKWEAGHEA